MIIKFYVFKNVLIVRRFCKRFMPVFNIKKRYKTVKEYLTLNFACYIVFFELYLNKKLTKTILNCAYYHRKNLYLSIWHHKLNQIHTIKQKRCKNWSPLKHCWQKFYTIKMIKYFDVWKINNDRKFDSNKHYWNSSNENFDRF